MLARVRRIAAISVEVIRREGLGSFLRLARRRLIRAAVVSAAPLGAGVDMLVDLTDAERVDWTSTPEWRRSPIRVTEGGAEIAWFSSPPGAESGGHQNLFRFIRFAEDHGHRCRIYIYDHRGHRLADVRSMLERSSAYPELAASIEDYDPAMGVAPTTQAVFASGWETAYPAFLDPSRARRFYFVQDFEPSFYPVGSESLLAENTYRFGFHGITAGGWLATKLHDEYGMSTDHFDFAVDTSLYHVTNHGPRKEIFFYARPVTSRRAFEFGVIALAEFARRRPEITINMAGWNLTGWNVPFPHQNLASLPLPKLNEVYNRCAAGLVLSLTNMSLLPLELLASGVAAVVNDAPNNRLVSDDPYIEYVPTSPSAIADRIELVLDRKDAIERSAAMSASASAQTWEQSGRAFVEAFERAMRG